MPSDSISLRLAAGLTAGAVVLFAGGYLLPGYWLHAAFLVASGLAVGSAVMIAGQHFGPGDDSGRAGNALLVVLYLLFIVISSYNVFVLEIGTGAVRDFILIVIGMTVPATLLTAGRATGRVPEWAGGG